MSSNRNKVFILAFISILASIAGVLKVMSIESPFYRLTLYDIPVIISGFTLGPIYGGTVGLIADIVQMLYKGYPPSLMTLSSILWGVIPGIFFLFRNKIKNRLSKNIMMGLTVIITSITAFMINSLQIYILWEKPGFLAQLPARITTLAVKLPIQIFISIIIYYAYHQLIKEKSYLALEK